MAATKFSAALRPPRELRRTRAALRTCSAIALISVAVIVAMGRSPHRASAFFQYDP
ncbi:hypothetical protein [Amycolatopsis sp. MEPSY49]|uniref:hypothetical protein n=1 Tax=Amycolatopsis sp. MEPSY49 TaxID=3151600 RepID=UPI003EFAB336